MSKRNKHEMYSVKNNFLTAKIQDSRFKKHLFVINIQKIKYTDNKILTGDPYKRTYIEPLSQRPRLGLVRKIVESIVMLLMILANYSILLRVNIR